MEWRFTNHPPEGQEPEPTEYWPRWSITMMKTMMKTMKTMKPTSPTLKVGGRCPGAFTVPRYAEVQSAKMEKTTSLRPYQQAWFDACNDHLSPPGFDYCKFTNPTFLF